MNIALRVLSSRRLYCLLILLNIMASVAVFILALDTRFPDAEHYLNLGKSLEHGQFSPWYFLDTKSPSTLRTPGYPLFILFLRIFSKSVFFIQFVQLLIYYFVLFLLLRLLNKFDILLIYKNLFLVILLPNVQVAYYTGYVSTETITVLFLVLLVFVYYMLKASAFKYVLLAFMSGIIFLIRPIFLLFPILFVIYNLFSRKRNSIKYTLIYAMIYGVMLIPFGLWNYYNHGVFKVTPLDGGACVLHLGFWQHKLPGYRDNYYWWEYMGNEIVKFVKDEEELNQNISRYNQEWGQINSECLKYFNQDDVKREKLMTEYNATHIPQFLVYGSNYVLAREKALLKFWLKNVLREPAFFIKTRLYTAIRLWITGIDTGKFKKAVGLKTILKIVYPFLVTFITFVFGFLIIALGLLRKVVRYKDVDFMLLLIIYYGLIHIPFNIQSRYTIPVHLLVFFLITLVLGRYLEARGNRKESLGA